MKITSAMQRNAVSEGTALGLVMCGRDRIPYDKMRVDLAFEDAWHGWQYRRRFSQVDTDLRNGSPGSGVMSRAGQRRQVWSLFWDRTGRELVIYQRGETDDDIDPEFAAKLIAGEVPSAGWRALAEAFLDHLER